MSSQFVIHGVALMETHFKHHQSFYVDAASTHSSCRPLLYVTARGMFYFSARDHEVNRPDREARRRAKWLNCARLLRDPGGVDEEVSTNSGMFALDRRRHPQRCGGREEEEKKKLKKTHCPVLHELETGAEVGQADVAVHIQQNVVGLNVPKKREEGREGEGGGWAPPEPWPG